MQKTLFHTELALIRPWQELGVGSVYLVGGAIRDLLMGMPVKDRDFVIVGATEPTLLSSGFFRIGKDFPVFLHRNDPEKQEFAMARTEKKSGIGHTAFTTQTANISLEEDLSRRDLTINAMALSADGQLIDPYGGLIDLEKKVLRHTSPAFSDDPLRVLRLARFAARYTDFTVAPETLALCREMANAGELSSLSAERVWKELSRALMEPAPEKFIGLLHECGALAAFLPEVDALFGIPQTAAYHPEICTGQHILLCLKRAAALNTSLNVRYAVLMHDLGKGVTDPSLLPKHHGHEEAGEPLVEAVNRRFTPKAIGRFAKFVCKNHLLAHTSTKLTAKRLLTLIEDAGGNHDSNCLDEFTLATQCDAQGRLGLEDQPYPARDFLLGALAAYRAIDVKSQIVENNPIKTSEQIRLARLNALKDYRASQGCEHA